MFKKIFFQGITAGILASVAGLIYKRIWFFATEADFSRVLGNVRIIAGCVGVSLLASFLFWGLTSWLGRKGLILFNFIFSMGSFAAVMIPISATLPLDLPFPELFPGLAVPMVFFPALAWMTIHPLFVHDPDK